MLDVYLVVKCLYEESCKDTVLLNAGKRVKIIDREQVLLADDSMRAIGLIE